MSDGFDIDPPDDDMETLAAEYVLGLLTVAQLPHVVALRHGSARFDRAVQQWELRLLPLAEALDPVQPSPRVWAGIKAAIAQKQMRGGIWNSLNFWRGLGISAGALCAALIAAILLRPPAALPSATAMLTSKSQGVFLATAQMVAGGTRLVVSPSQVIIPPGKSAELWLITPGNKPAALGLLASNRPVAITIPGLGANLSLAELAISIEPPGGSPTGQATGPVIAEARFLPL
jgi:anti-sigma-K factor RskA